MKIENWWNSENTQALVPQPEVRRELIHIFFDMMECEAGARGNFHATEQDMTDKLDQCIQDGLGDTAYQEAFEELMVQKCGRSSNLQVRGALTFDVGVVGHPNIN